MTTYQTLTLPAWNTRYIAIRQDDLAKKTIDIHSRTLGLLVEFFGDVLVDEITRSMATDWRLWLKKTMMESTTCKYCRSAKAIFNVALDDELIDRNPFKKLKGTPPKKDIFSRRLISEHDVLTIIQHGSEIAPMVALCYYAGLRTSEALHLMSDDITDRIKVRPRCGQVTTKQRYREVRVEPELDSMFPGTGTACNLVERGRHNLIYKTLRDACNELGIEPFTFQQCRQTRDSIWHKQFPSYVVCAWLGHSEQVSREHYLTIDESFYSSSPITQENT